jgi:glycerophosphoryl diester phosphodiesterase
LLAHRGASADAPENTIAAFEEAVRQGADGVELDAQICGSGEVVVCHDERLTRLARLDWELARTPWWKLKRADVGTPLGFAPARIPLLEDVIQLLPDRFLINLELKCETVEDHRLCAGVVEVIGRQRVAERVIISSFNPFCLWRTAALAPQLRRGFLIDPEKNLLWQSSVLAPLVCNHSIHPPLSASTPERLARWRDLGLRVACWTVDDAAAAAELRQNGVAYCITNRPGALREGLSLSGRL